MKIRRESFHAASKSCDRLIVALERSRNADSNTPLWGTGVIVMTTGVVSNWVTVMNRSAQLCVCILACTLFAFSQVVCAQVAIPDGVTVRLVPAGLDPIDDERNVYQLKNDMWVSVYIENRSKQRLKWNVIDPHYVNRLQLFKDDVLIPYREEITNIIRLQDANLKQLQVETRFFVDPDTTYGFQNIPLYDWYGPLLPGIYRVIIRHRFEIGGPWTRDSLPMLFEVPEPKINTPRNYKPPEPPKLIRKTPKTKG